MTGTEARILSPSYKGEIKAQVTYKLYLWAQE